LPAVFEPDGDLYKITYSDKPFWIEPVMRANALLICPVEAGKWQFIIRITDLDKHRIALFSQYLFNIEVLPELSSIIDTNKIHKDNKIQ
jgi:hypothetical protein